MNTAYPELLRMLFRIAVALAVGLPPAPAQTPVDLPYTSGSTGADGALTFPIPLGFSPGRHGLSLSYDVARGQLVMHGGFNRSGDTWLWTGTNWTNTGKLGPQVGYHSSAYDIKRQEIVLFGGWIGNSYVNDTFVWNGTNWEKQNTVGANPRALANPGMVYDEAREQIVLVGDHAGANTWTWEGTNWTLITSPNTPAPRHSYGLAYDAARRQTVLFGGGDPNNAPLNDTWTWNGTNWIQRFPASSPPARYGQQMAYDAIRQQIVLFGGRNSIEYLNDTWLWNGSTWVQSAITNKPLARSYHAMTFHAERGEIFLVGGGDGRTSFDDTWTWNGTEWNLRSASTQFFDMSQRSDGLWHFTSIDVPQGLTVKFIANALNTPVRWLAKSNVTISGTLDLSGEHGNTHASPLAPARGGPGGFSGGLGGLPPQLGGAQGGEPGMPGDGPGGGASGNLVAGTNTANLYVQPLIGGSGGGGTPTEQGARGGRGGGGGGAILISSSLDLNVNGQIIANGGFGEDLRQSSGRPWGGHGAPGSIRLVADRINISGDVSAATGGTVGRIRLESYERQIPSGLAQRSILSAPVATRDIDRPFSRIQIVEVAGKPVQNVPESDLLTPDIIFEADGQITVRVRGDGLPDGTPVRLRFSGAGLLLHLPAPGDPQIALSGGLATFNLNVPKGRATLQAFADVKL